MERKSKRPEKLPDPLKLARRLWAAEKVRDTRHSAARRGERAIDYREVGQVIRSGYHEKSKDEFKPEWNSWNYAIRGKTVDDRKIRIAVAFEGDTLLILVTTIAL